MRVRMRRPLAWLTFVLGLATAVPAALHTIAVIGVAYRERGGYDARLADLLWIGWTSLVCGALMVASSRAIGRGSRTAYWTATGASAVFLVSSLFIAIVAPSFWTALPLYGGYLLLAWWVRPDRGVRGTDAGSTNSKSVMLSNR
jgi:hypothetical protein